MAGPLPQLPQRLVTTAGPCRAWRSALYFWWRIRCGLRVLLVVVSALRASAAGADRARSSSSSRGRGRGSKGVASSSAGAGAGMGPVSVGNGVDGTNGEEEEEEEEVAWKALVRHLRVRVRRAATVKESVVPGR